MGLFRREVPAPVPKESRYTARELAEIDALEDLQRARRAEAQALKLADMAERTMIAAIEAREYAAREVRRISEAKVRPTDA